jgi:hypothetical protein
VNPKKISIELSIDEAKKIIHIVLDEDAENAQKFIKNDLLEKVQAALQPL